MQQQENQVPAKADTFGKTVWLGARSLGEFAEAEPMYARWVPTRSQILRITELRGLVLDMKLCRIAAPGSPDRWGPENEDGSDYEDKARLQSHEMVVDNDSVWFEANPKNDDGIETFMVSIDELLKALSGEEEHIFFGENGAESLRDDVLACGDVNLPEVSA